MFSIHNVKGRNMKRIITICNSTVFCLLCVLFTACPGGDDSDDPQPNPPIPVDNTGGGTNNDDELTNYVALDNSWPSLYSNGKYTHQIFLRYGVSKGHYSYGINEFGVCVRTPDGTVTNKTGQQLNNSYISNETINGKSMKYFYSFIFNDNKQDFGAMLYITSTMKTITVECVRHYYNQKSNKYVTGGTETFTYTPKEIANK